MPTAKKTTPKKSTSNTKTTKSASAPKKKGSSASTNKVVKKFALPKVKFNLVRKEAKSKTAVTKTVDENLRPESRLAKTFNRASSKASEVGAKEVGNPTPTTGKLAKRVDPFSPIKWTYKYVRDSIRELKQVTWPTRPQAWRLTGTVFLFSVVMALFLFAIDSGFNKLFELIFLQD